MNKEPRLFESLISDVDRTSRREKISKKTITDNIKNIVNLLDNTIQEIKNDIAIEEVNHPSIFLIDHINPVLKQPITFEI